MAGASDGSAGSECPAYGDVFAANRLKGLSDSHPRANSLVGACASRLPRKI